MPPRLVSVSITIPNEHTLCCPCRGLYSHDSWECRGNLVDYCFDCAAPGAMPTPPPHTLPPPTLVPIPQDPGGLSTRLANPLLARFLARVARRGLTRGGTCRRPFPLCHYTLFLPQLRPWLDDAYRNSGLITHSHQPALAFPASAFDLEFWAIVNLTPVDHYAFLIIT